MTGIRTVRNGRGALGSLVAAAAMLTLAACGDDSPTSPGASALAGTYRMDIRASVECGTALGAGRQQEFDATIAQSGSDIQLTLQSRRDLPTQGGFEGRVTGPSSLSADGEVLVTSTDADDPDEYEASGRIGATVGANRIEGELNGVIRFGEAICEAPDHRVELRRQ